MTLPRRAAEAMRALLARSSRPLADAHSDGAVPAASDDAGGGPSAAPRLAAVAADRSSAAAWLVRSRRPSPREPPAPSSGAHAHGRDVEAHVVQRQAHPRDDRRGERLAALCRAGARGARRGSTSSRTPPRPSGRWAAPRASTASDGEARLATGAARSPAGPANDPRRPADELRGGVAGDRLDHLPHAVDVARASALDLKHPARPQRPGEAGPEPLVVADPVQRRRRDQIASTGSSRSRSSASCAPHLGAVAQPARGRARPSPPTRRAASTRPRGTSCQQRLGHPPGAATDVEDRRVGGDAVQASHYLRRPMP